MVGVWLIVLASSSSVMPDSKENKQADAGSRRFRRHFLCGALLCNFLSTQHEGLSTHVQREWSAEPFMPSILSQPLKLVSEALLHVPLNPRLQMQRSGRIECAQIAVFIPRIFLCCELCCSPPALTVCCEAWYIRRAG